MLFAAKEFLNVGHEVCIAGFDSLLSLCDIRVTDVPTAAAWADIVVLPVRPLKDGYLNAPYSSIKIPAAALMAYIGDTPVFTGCGDALEPYAAGSVHDYTLSEMFTYRNAQLTAEGAVGILLNDYEGSVYGSKILVTGYGRIGKLLSAMLRSLGADVTVAARRESDRALAVLSGMKAADYEQIDYGRYDVVFNTVPAFVLDSKVIDQLREDVFIVDLASAPGGVDFRRAGERGLSVIHALSLPGRTAPHAAGRIIRDTVLKSIRDGEAFRNEGG